MAAGFVAGGPQGGGFTQKRLCTLALVRIGPVSIHRAAASLPKKLPRRGRRQTCPTPVGKRSDSPFGIIARSRRRRPRGQNTKHLPLTHRRKSDAPPVSCPRDQIGSGGTASVTR